MLTDRQICASFWLIALVTWPAQAGTITVSEAQLLHEDNRITASVFAEIELNNTVERGLQSGVPLFFNADLKLVRPRILWWDSTLAESRRRYSLVYYELTRHYRISAVDSEAARNFRSLLAALEYLGNVRNLWLEHHSPLDSSVQYKVVFDFHLDADALPLALRPQALVSSDWRVVSEEFVWHLN